MIQSLVALARRASASAPPIRAAAPSFACAGVDGLAARAPPPRRGASGLVGCGRGAQRVSVVFPLAPASLCRSLPASAWARGSVAAYSSGGASGAAAEGSSASASADALPPPSDLKFLRNRVPRTPHCILNFYAIADLSSAEVDAQLAAHRAFLEPLDVQGRIYLSEQGINVQAGGSTRDALAYVRWVAEREGSPFYGARYALYPAPGRAHPKLRLKRRQLLSLPGGLTHLELSNVRNRAVPLEPFEWVSGAAKDAERAVVLDLRNGYEWDAGHFEGAARPLEDEFHETPYVDTLERGDASGAMGGQRAPHEAGAGREGAHEAGAGREGVGAASADGSVAAAPPVSSLVPAPLADKPKDTPVYMYCTGGIRCDVYSAHLTRLGYTKLYTLEGGVQAYAEQLAKEEKAASEHGAAATEGPEAAKSLAGGEEPTPVGSVAAGEETATIGSVSGAEEPATVGSVAAGERLAPPLGLAELPSRAPAAQPLTPAPVGASASRIGWKGSLFVFDSRMAAAVPSRTEEEEAIWSQVDRLRQLKHKQEGEGEADAVLSPAVDPADVDALGTAAAASDGPTAALGTAAAASDDLAGAPDAPAASASPLASAALASPARRRRRSLPAAIPCELCGERPASLPHANCANVDCNRLFVACDACRGALRGACSVQCLSAPRLLRPPLPEDEGQYGNWVSAVENALEGGAAGARGVGEAGAAGAGAASALRPDEAGAPAPLARSGLPLAPPFSPHDRPNSRRAQQIINAVAHRMAQGRTKRAPRHHPDREARRAAEIEERRRRKAAAERAERAGVRLAPADEAWERAARLREERLAKMLEGAGSEKAA